VPPLPPAEPPAPAPKRRLPVLLLVAGVAASVAAALLLWDARDWFADDVDAPAPDQASIDVPDVPSSARPATALEAADLWLQAIALPALESEGQLLIYFRLSAPAAWPVDITYRTLDNTAEAGKDFVAQSGIITIPPGERTVEVSIPLIEDGLAERVEMFLVTLAIDPDKATLTESELMATVLDDDQNDEAVGADTVN
jgi:hypothetical protein